MSAIIEAPPESEKFYMTIEAAGYGYTLTREQFIDVIEQTLSIMGAHLHEYERDDLRKFALNAQQVSFGSWNREPGCPLQQCKLADIPGVSTDHELFTEHFDRIMCEQWGLDISGQGTATIL